MFFGKYVGCMDNPVLYIGFHVLLYIYIYIYIYIIIYVIYIYYGLVWFYGSKRDNDEIMLGYSWDVPSGNETWPC